MEHPQLGWPGRINYMTAKAERQTAEVYVWDLVWLLARNRLTDDARMPSDIWWNRKKDKRSAKQIASDLMKKLGGE
ncbi:MAG: hypothetical protein J6S82_03655 [Bacteroidales bacterium]|nr:hypothetical protein [Bacteroidales bacterium]